MKLSHNSHLHVLEEVTIRILGYSMASPEMLSDLPTTIPCFLSRWLDLPPEMSVSGPPSRYRWLQNLICLHTLWWEIPRWVSLMIRSSSNNQNFPQGSGVILAINQSIRITFLFLSLPAGTGLSAVNKKWEWCQWGFFTNNSVVIFRVFCAAGNWLLKKMMEP